jgi:hypothetical protein
MRAKTERNCLGTRGSFARRFRCERAHCLRRRLWSFSRCALVGFAAVMMIGFTHDASFLPVFCMFYILSFHEGTHTSYRHLKDGLECNVFSWHL